MTPLRLIYLALAIIGAVVPMFYFVLWFSANGVDLPALFDAWRANDASTGLAWDLLIAATALTIWIVVETWVRKNWVALWAIPATFLIGVSCGLPLFLYLRTRPVT